MFKNANNWTKQGDIGESYAIYKFTSLGYMVSKPLFDSSKYDLIVEKDNFLYKVQIKTTRHKVKGKYVANLATGGGNRSSNSCTPRHVDDYDLLFVLSENEDSWLIPASSFNAKHSIVVDSSIYDKYKV